MQSKSLCISEVFARYYLNPDEMTAALLDEILPHGERQEFQARLFSPSGIEPDLTAPFWKTEDRFSAMCEKAIRAKMNTLLSEDGIHGFIPVYLTSDEKNEAIFIPFHFEKMQPGPAVIRDIDGKNVEKWQPYYEQLRLSEDCIVHCRQE